MFTPRAIALSKPNTIAYRLSQTGETVSDGQLEARSNQGAQLFRSSGLKAGDHIVIFMENNRHFVEVCFSAERSGLYYTAINTHLNVAEIEYIVNDCRAKLLITSYKIAEFVSTLASMTPRVKHRFMVGSVIQGYESWEDAIVDQPDNPIKDEIQGLDMLYLSGTTGRPKGVKWPLAGKNLDEPTMLLDLLGRLYGYD